MKLRWLLATLLAIVLSPIVAFSQVYTPQGSTYVAEPNFTTAPFTLSTVCTTPLTPASCPSTSYQIIPLNAAGEFSMQITAINGATISWFTSNDGVNFNPSNMSVGSTNGLITIGQSTTSNGKFTTSGSSSSYLEVAITTLGTAPVTITPNISQHSSAVSIHASIPLPVTGTINISPIGVGSIFTVPAPASSSVPVALGTAPATATSFMFILGPLTTVSYTLAATQSSAATACTTTPNPLVINAYSAQTQGDHLWPDNSVFSSLPVWICYVNGNVRARYL